MSSSINNCPVCNAILQNSLTEFCPTCNWDLVVVSNSASEEMKKYFSDKLAKYQYQYETTQTLKIKIETLKAESTLLNKKIESAEEKLENYPHLMNISKEFEEYKLTHPDSVIISTANVKEQAISIFWEHCGNLKFKFYGDDIEKNIPRKIVLLLKQSNLPHAYGDCDLSILIATSGYKKLSKDSIELFVNNKFVKEGSYYSKFMNLNYSIANIIFFHKEQALGNQESYKSKTLITF